MTLILKHFKKIIRVVERDVKRKFKIKTRLVGITKLPNSYGLYYPDPNYIELDLWTKNKKKYQSPETFLNTLSHELGHAKDRESPHLHGRSWKRHYEAIWKYVRRKYL